MKKVIKISGMSCGHCEGRVKNALTELGVKVLKVSAAEDVAEIEMVEGVTMDQVVEAIEDSGYDVVEVI